MCHVSIDDLIKLDTLSDGVLFQIKEVELQ